MIKTLLKETLRGKTIPRTLMNLELQKYTGKNPIVGKTIDLGSKSSGMSYNRFMSTGGGCEITYTDLDPSDDKVVKLDLEEEFPIEDEKYDTIICLNVLEHIYRYENVIKEAARISKPGGVFIGSVPFLIPFHPDPNDYFRYTKSAIIKLFEENGYEKIKMKSMGIGPFTTGLYNIAMLMPKWLRVIAVVKLICMDKILNLFTRGRHKGNKYTLGYFFVFRKK